MDNVLERLSTLEDYRGIEQLLYMYAHTIDQHLADEWLDLFVADARYRSIRISPSGERETIVDFQGVEAFRKFITDFTSGNRRPPGDSQKNFISQPIIRLHGDTAEAVTYFHLVVVHNGVKEIFANGRYFDTLVRCSDSKWRFSDRMSEVE